MNANIKIRINVFSLLLVLGMMSCKSDIIKDSTKSDRSNAENVQKVNLPELDPGSIIIQGITDYYDEVYRITFETKDKWEMVEFDSLQFKVEFESDGPSIVKISHGYHRAFPVFSLPGDSVIIDFKLIDFLNEVHTQKIFGSRVGENRALAKLDELLILDNPIYKHQFETTETKYLAKMDSLEQEGLSIFKAFNKKYNLSPYFEKYYFSFLDYKIREFLVRYLNSKRNPGDNTPPILSDKFNSKLSSYNKQDSNLIEIYPYLKYLKDRVFELTTDPQSPIANFIAIDSTFTDNEIIHLLKYELIRNELRRLGYFKKSLKGFRPQKTSGITIRKSTYGYDFLEKIEEYIELYRASNPPEKYRNIIMEAYDDLMK